MEEERLTKSERRARAKEEKRKEREGENRSKKLKNWFIGLLVFIGLFYGGYKVVAWINTPQGDVGQVSVEVGSDEWIQGNPEAQVTLVEYSDFQCPACKNYYPLVKRLGEELGQNMRIVYRNLPLVSIHKNSFAASTAAEAAGRQGKFWEMHDILFEKQDEWVADSSPEDKFEQYADSIGLDMEKFKADYQSDEVKNDINSDLTTATSLRLNSTPSFILDGRKIEGPTSYDNFKSVVEDEIRGYSVK